MEVGMILLEQNPAPFKRDISIERDPIGDHEYQRRAQWVNP
jgi:hypothetical protein